MDNSQIVRLRIVRVCIARRGFAMGSPTGMGNTHTTTDILVAAVFCQVVNLTFCLINIEIAVTVNQRYTGRVITSVFQSSETFNQHRISLLMADISNYSTHISFCICILFGCKGKKKSAIPSRIAELFLLVELKIPTSVVVGDVLNHLSK